MPTHSWNFCTLSLNDAVSVHHHQTAALTGSEFQGWKCSAYINCHTTTFSAWQSFNYILLTVHHIMIIGKWPTWHTNSFLCTSSSRRWTSFNGWKFWPSQRPLSISLDPGCRLSNFLSSFGKCPVWCYPPICTWVFLVIFWLGVSN